ncbi:MAG: hypothetical protein KIT14_11255 [bacterium]|nr:hypothetical protein [bacterium]
MAHALARSLRLLLVASGAHAVTGSLDPQFGSGGTVTTPVPGPSGAEGVLVQPDGEIVAAGSPKK